MEKIRAIYSAPAAASTSTGSYQTFTIFWLWNIRSGTVMTETSVEDFTTTVNWLTSEGAAVSSACGSTMRRKTWTCDMPTASAASRWARGTASIPVRKVSARYPLDWSASATQPAVKKVFGQPRISGQT